jgi:hypothetical protein
MALVTRIQALQVGWSVMRLLLAFLLTLSMGLEPAWAKHKTYPAVDPGITCPGDRVVWVNTNSGIYHLEGERWFGRTAAGKFMCEKDAQKEGDRETKNGQ